MKRILYAEDDPTVRLVMTKLFDRLPSVEAEIAVDGHEAIEKLGPGFDMVLSDYRMPGPNGNEVLAEAAKSCPGALRVLLTAYDPVDFDTQFAHRVFTKPAGIKEVLALIQENPPINPSQ